MHDILVTLGITLLLFLIIATGIGIWILWSFRPITQKEQDDLMETINRLKAEEEELRAKVEDFNRQAWKDSFEIEVERKIFKNDH